MTRTGTQRENLAISITPILTFFFADAYTAPESGALLGQSGQADQSAEPGVKIDKDGRA
jgi:hypothetical protein